MSQTPSLPSCWVLGVRGWRGEQVLMEKAAGEGKARDTGREGPSAALGSGLLRLQGDPASWS